MTSILTNTGSMVALQTLRSINANLSKTQSEISTGKSVASAKDNAAVWAISKTMESDVKGFDKIESSLSLGESTVAVARKAAEKITDLLTEMKGKIVSGQEDNVPQATIQTDIDALTAQIKSVVAAAQFNGMNLVDGSLTTQNTDGNTGINVLASLDRDGAGNVTASSIGVDAQNLSVNAGTSIAAAVLKDDTGGAVAATDGVVSTDLEGAVGAATADFFTIDTFTFLDNAGAATGAVALSRTTSGVDNGVAGGLVEGDQLVLRIGSVEGAYTVQTGDTADSVVAGIKNSLIQRGLSETDFTIDISGSGAFKITNNTNEDATVEFSMARGNGALADLDSIDIVADAEGALASIETMIDAATDSAARLGSVEGRISTQKEFISSLSDSLTTGIGALIDADMEEVSARLQALQTQQQLGIQSRSIANQAPQNVLSLFK